MARRCCLSVAAPYFFIHSPSLQLLLAILALASRERAAFGCGCAATGTRACFNRILIGELLVSPACNALLIKPPYCAWRRQAALDVTSSCPLSFSSTLLKAA